MGKGYVIKYCRALLCKKNEDNLYRTYVTEALMALVNSTGRYQIERYSDIVEKVKQNKQEKTADEIVADVIKRAGLTLKEGS